MELFLLSVLTLISVKAFDSPYRLPKTIVPSKYDLTVTPYLETNDTNNFTFSGIVNITFKVTTDSVTRIRMHAKDLRLHGTPTLTPHIPINNVTSDTTYDFLDLNLDYGLSLTTEYTLTMSYEGKIQSGMTGFYRSHYEEDEKTKWLATTQFQNVHAREAFPCFDEPEYKSVFILTMNCPVGMSCRSNMKATVNPTTNIHVFEPTPIMSTYMLAFMVSEFVETDSDGRFTILARPDTVNQGKYPYEVALELTDEIGNFTGIDYFDHHSDPGIAMKMDHAAIPDFFAAGMENWGLITYREPYLMIDENESSTAARQRVAATVSHEIAHLWFGNLVTCHWWEDAWLNEGFSRYLEYFATHNVRPSFGMNDQFITSQIHAALSDDASTNSKPLSNPDVNSPPEISEHFVKLTYPKGASVVRMIAQWIGEAAFLKGINYYLNSKKHGIAYPEDIYVALQRACDENGAIDEYQISVEKLFEPWIVQSGYPVLTVWVNSSDGNLMVEQNRFVKENEQPVSALFRIPISFATKSKLDFNNTKAKLIMSDRIISLGKHDNEWIILNVQQTAYYRVLYSDELYEYINEYMATDDWIKIHEYNRAQLVDDAFNFASESMIEYSQLFDIIQFLEKELQYTPWIAAHANINKLRIMFQHFNQLSEKFDMHIRNLMETVIKQLGFSTEGSDLVNIFRMNTMSLVCDLKQEDCIRYSIQMFENWNARNGSIPADHRQFVYCTGLRNGTELDFDKLWNKYLSEQVANERIVIMNALGCTTYQNKLKQYLTETIQTNSKIRQQDKMLVFNSVLRGNKENIIGVWDFFSDNIPNIRNSYGTSNLMEMMGLMTSRMHGDLLAEFDELITSSSILSINEKEAGKNALTAARKRISWVGTKEENILQWIENKYTRL